MNQEEYNRFYNKLKGYAFMCASDLFHDRALKEQAVDEAMDKLEDKMITIGDVDIPLARKIVHDSLVNSFKAKDIEGDYSTRWPGSSIYHKVSKHKPLKVRLEQITSKPEKRIIELYSQGKTQTQIWKQLKVTKQYISEVVIKYTKQ